MPKTVERGNVTKTVEIRKAISQHPNKSVKEIVEFLSEQGVEVKPSLVGYCKYKRPDLTRPEKRKRRQAKNHNTKATEPTVSLKDQVSDLIEFKEAIDALGGIETVKAKWAQVTQLQKVIDF